MCCSNARRLITEEIVNELDECGVSMASGNDETRVRFHGQNGVSGKFQSVNSKCHGNGGEYKCDCQ